MLLARTCSIAATICAGAAVFSSVRISATFVSLIVAVGSGIVVVDELDSVVDDVSWILVSGDGCDVCGVVSTGRVGITED